MSELRTLLADTTEKVLGGLDGLAFDDAWARVADAGLHKVLVPEEQGGFSGTWSDALIVIRACGYHAVELPLPEAILASLLCARAGLTIPDGPLTLAEGHDGAVTDGFFTGSILFAPYGAQCVAIAAANGLDNTFVVSSGEPAERVSGVTTNAQDERDSFHFIKLPVQAGEAAGWDNVRVEHHLMLMRTAQMAGALRAALDLSVRYVRERQQFGKPLASFQAIQQQLAVFAEETAATEMAAAAAFAAAEREPRPQQPDEGLAETLKDMRKALLQHHAQEMSPDLLQTMEAELERRMPHMLSAIGRQAPFEFIAAKLRANMAVGVATGIAHQVHGAMGFTKEYPLQRLTRKLWQWRSGRGDDRALAARLGWMIAARGADGFWPGLVAPATIGAPGSAD